MTFRTMKSWGAGLLIGAALLASPGDAIAQATDPQATTPRPRTSPTSPPTSPRRDDAGLFDDGRVEREGDEQKPFRFASRFEFELQNLDNFDLDSSENRDVLRLLPEVRLEFTYEPDEDFLAFASFEIGKPFERVQGSGWSSSERLEVREAFLHFKDVIEDVEVQVGRQRFDDGREWLYDDRLDALRVTYDENDLKVEVAVGRVGLAPIDLFHPRRRDKTDNFLVRAEYEINGDWDVAAYALAQKDRTDEDESPTFFGVQSEGKLVGNLAHWLELSLQRGRDQDRKLRGNAIDAGLIYHLETPLRPALVLGYARGSGGGSDGTDRNFRQTGLQDNEDRLTGLANVAYYGELLAPELSNLRILTVGAGIRPSAASSIELIAHHYRQVALDDDEIRDSPLTAETNGESAAIGVEIDLIGALRISDALGVETKLGYFKPGKAFGDGADDALFAKARFVYRF